MTFFIKYAKIFSMEQNLGNIILIGMPACGKSTAGVLAAKALGFGFIDSDLIIQTKEKRLLSDLLQERGEQAFIEIENAVNASLWAERCVISTGGSVVYCEEAMAHLKSLGKVIYLKLSYGEIEKRLKNVLNNRGVVIKEGQNLRALYDERTPLYEKYADFTVDCENHGVEDTVSAIYNYALNQ